MEEASAAAPAASRPTNGVNAPAWIRSVTSFFSYKPADAQPADAPAEGDPLERWMVPVRKVDTLAEAQAELDYIREIAVKRSTLAAEATAAMTLLSDALRDADTSLDHAGAGLSHAEEECSAKLGEFVQKNAHLRLEAKNAERRAAKAEEDLEYAQKQIAALEQALTDAALATDDAVNDFGRPPLATGEATSVQSLGAGHGGVDIGTSSYSPPNRLSPTSAICEGVMSPPAASNSNLGSPDASAMYSSPAKLSMDEGISLPEISVTKHKNAGCCTIS